MLLYHRILFEQSPLPHAANRSDPGRRRVMFAFAAAASAMLAAIRLMRMPILT